ncbi:MAG TPA: hypothetical protein PKD37_07925 [Oligoflexia bacterium]|nr:hypothetical protein [Oligoflexia bacterium]HMP27890.1 hypothetical protein [Oligoflexia bacterium]
MPKLKTYKQKLIEKMADGELNRLGCFLVNKLILKDDVAISYLSEILSIRQGLISTTLLEKSKNNQLLSKDITDNKLNPLYCRLEGDLKERGWQAIEARIREESRAAFFHGERAWSQSEQLLWRRCFSWFSSLFARPVVFLPRYGYGAAMLAMVVFGVFYLQNGNNFGAKSGGDNFQLASAGSELSDSSGVEAAAAGSNSFLKAERFTDDNLLVFSSGNIMPPSTRIANKRIERSQPIISDRIMASGDNTFLRFANSSFALNPEKNSTIGSLLSAKELSLNNQTTDRRLRLAYNPAVNLAKRQIRSLGDSFPKHILGYASRGDYLSYSGKPQIVPDNYPVNMPVSALR